MKPADLIRELIYPLTSATIVMAVLFFWFLFGLAQRAGLFGIALIALTLPAYLRFLLYLLEERANDRAPPVPDIGMFNPVDNLWTLTPLILFAALLWVDRLLGHPQFGTLAGLVGIGTLLAAPASMAILAVTHSPAESLNPAALVRMVRVCGWSYLFIPGAMIALSLVFVFLAVVGLPLFIVDLGTSYQFALLFSLTGAVLRANGVAMQVEIPDAVQTNESEIAADLEIERRNVATHAYGFVSRGNRDGGLAHIRDWVGKEADTTGAGDWFLQEMLRWESKHAALLFAQDFVAHLLSESLDADAIKLVSRCLHEDSRWKPLQRDREAVLELAEKFQRDDLLKFLKN